MVRVIMGVKGTGKTKQMIELINSAVHSENGNVVCIERGPKLTYDIHYKNMSCERWGPRACSPHARLTVGDPKK